MLCCAELTARESLQIQLVTVGRGRASWERPEFWVPEMALFGAGSSVRQVEHGYVFRRLGAR